MSHHYAPPPTFVENILGTISISQMVTYVCVGIVAYHFLKKIYDALMDLKNLLQKVSDAVVIIQAATPAPTQNSVKAQNDFLRAEARAAVMAEMKQAQEALQTGQVYVGRT